MLFKNLMLFQQTTIYICIFFLLGCNPKQAQERHNPIRTDSSIVRNQPITLMELLSPVVEKMERYRVTTATARVDIDNDLKLGRIDLIIERIDGEHKMFYRSGKMNMKIRIEQVFPSILLIVQREWNRFEKEFYIDIQRQSPLA